MSIKELKEREKEQRRDYIVDAAEKLFFSRGYDNVSMNDIAEAVEMNKATLYLYFKSKDAIYFAIVVRGVRIMNEMFRQGIVKETDGISRVGATGAAYLEFSRQYPDYNRLFQYAGSERFDAASSEDAKEAARLSTEILVMMGKAIGAGMRDGTVRPDLNPLTVAIYFATASQAIVSLNPTLIAALASQGVSHQQFIEDSMKLMLSSIASQPTMKRSD